MNIRLFIADDHELIRGGLRALFRESGVEIVGEADAVDNALQGAEALRPDVTLVDVRLPLKQGRADDCGGLALLEKLHAQDVSHRVVMFSSFENPTYVARSIALGARDYVLKGMSRAEIIGAVFSAHRETEPISPLFHQVRRCMLLDDPIEEDGFAVTPRESQVLRNIALGLSNKEIARSLGISVETVKEHVQNILRKLPVGDRTQAAVWAVRKGIV
jgi:DNA-binding NarL/FixJ family response regulator